MKELLQQAVNPFYDTDREMLLFGDTFAMLPTIKPESIDMIFADPPYFLSNGGITCQGGQQASVNKGGWDKALSLKKSTISIEDGFAYVRLCSRQTVRYGSAERSTIFTVLVSLWSRKDSRF